MTDKLDNVNSESHFKQGIFADVPEGAIFSPHHIAGIWIKTKLGKVEGVATNASRVGSLTDKPQREFFDAMCGVVYHNMPRQPEQYIVLSYSTDTDDKQDWHVNLKSLKDIENWIKSQAENNGMDDFRVFKGFEIPVKRETTYKVCE